MLFKEFTPKPIFYFSYGMLCDPNNMKDAELFGKAELRNFSFEMMMYANVIESPGNKVIGVLWQLNRTFLGHLDKIEGCPWLYNRKSVPIFCDGKRYESELYTMTPERRDYLYGTLPSKEYVESIIDGYNNVGIPLKQLSTAIQEIPVLQSRNGNSILNEVNMSPSSLKKFTDSKTDENIMIGFEAEMIVPGLQKFDSDGDDIIEDLSKDIKFPTGPNMKKEILTWFENGDNPDSDVVIKSAFNKFLLDLSNYQKRQLNKYINTKEGKETLYKIIKDNRSKTIDSLGTSIADKEIWRDIRVQNNWYDEAFDIISNSYLKSNNFMAEFLDYFGIEKMSDFCDSYNLNYPYYKHEYNTLITIKELTDDFQKFTGLNVVYSQEYHSVTRKPNLWIFEPDISIIDNTKSGSGIELISPPIKLKNFYDQLNEFWHWAEHRKIITNNTCGFHVGISLPDQTTNKIDKLKLLFFLGENYVLKMFKREHNQYTKSSFDYMIHNLEYGLDYDEASKAFSLLKTDLNKLANHFFLQTLAVSTDKYHSINVRSKYIEFRLAGGNYLEQKNDIENTIMRYIRAMVIASTPEAEKKEYAKKLYKGLHLIYEDDDFDIIKIFAQYSSGLIDENSLKLKLKYIQNKRKNFK
jgi:gamma-glutamylcyclotransferase (GGCT)/AIG2-like uncharacterized protein YtfP